MKIKLDYKTIFTLYLPNRTLQLTREGGGFILLVFGIGVAAINTGNNLLYLVLAMCCSFIAVSGILSEYTLKNIEIEGTIPRTLYAEDPSPLSLKITNHKKRIPSYSLHIEVGPSEQFQMNESFYLFHIPPGTTVERTHMFTAYRRGPLAMTSCRLRTSFPFGFFIKSKTLPLDLETLVYPPIREVALPASNEFSDEGDGVVGHSGDDLYSLREFRPGDSLSAVHWKSSAKTGTIHLKEFATGGLHSFTLHLRVTDTESENTLDLGTLEQRVIETASLAYHLIRRGDEVRLKTHDHETPFGNTETHLENILEYLAMVGLEPPSRTKS